MSNYPQCSYPPSSNPRISHRYFHSRVCFEDYGQGQPDQKPLMADEDPPPVGYPSAPAQGYPPQQTHQGQQGIVYQTIPVATGSTIYVEQETCCNIYWVLFGIGFLFPPVWIAGTCGLCLGKTRSEHNAGIANAVLVGLVCFILLIYLICLIILISTITDWAFRLLRILLKMWLLSSIMVPEDH